MLVSFILIILPPSSSFIDRETNSHNVKIHVHHDSVGVVQNNNMTLVVPVERSGLKEIWSIQREILLVIRWVDVIYLLEIVYLTLKMEPHSQGRAI